MRGIKRKNFWIMEQTAGAGGWGIFKRNPRPGEIRSVAYQQLAHGCDGQIWFRWRTCTAGREQYWHGLLGHDGRALRRYQEAAQTAREYRQLEKEIANTTVKSYVAIIYHYDSMWAMDTQPGYAGASVQKALFRYYNALFRAGVNVDMIDSDADFTQYKVIIAPHLYILTDKVAEALTRFVQQGGVLLTDCRTGVKDENNLCHERTLPGKLAPVFGIEIEEYESITGGQTYPVSGNSSFSGAYTAVAYADWVKAKGAEVLAGFEQWHMKRYAALTRNIFGKGTGYYVGTIIQEDAFYDALIGRVLKDARIKPLITPPAGVEVSVRQGRGKRIVFLINHTEEPTEVSVPAGKLDLLSRKKIQSKITLERHGIAVIRW